MVGSTLTSIAQGANQCMANAWRTVFAANVPQLHNMTMFHNMWAQLWRAYQTIAAIGGTMQSNSSNNVPGDLAQ
eukprot:1720875-Amphidinium_carterae.2